MSAHTVDSSRFPDLIAVPAHPDGKPEIRPRCPDTGPGAARGLAFALLLEAALAIIVFSGWHLWRLLR